MKKALPFLLYGMIILAVAGLLLYQWQTEKSLEPSDLVKGALTIAAAALGMVRSGRRKKVSNKKGLYQKAYGEFIQGAFSDDPKLEKKFYNAVDDYNFNRYAAGVTKLNDLRRECQRTADLYAVTVFLALCCDGMGAYQEAIRYYSEAAQIRNNSTLHSNAGLCYLHLGKFEDAESAYRRAIQANEKNAFAWNNLAALYFKQADYAQALEYAQVAIQINGQMSQALSCAAICCAMLDLQDDYEKYYRQAVANGYDGKIIKNMIRSLNPET